MKDVRITGVRAWTTGLPLREGKYTWSNNNSISVFDSTVVAIDTNVGVTGYAECCPLGSVYLASYPNGVKAGVRELAPAVIGLDPTDIEVVNVRMDGALKGHAYAKSPIDIACWDIAGKLLDVPVYKLLGGSHQDAVPLYRAISQEDPEIMARKIAGYKAEGYRRFQLKVGGSADQDIARIRATRSILEADDVLIADANTGWTTREALRVAKAVSDLDIYFEQPCATYRECRAVRAKTDLPFVLDEVIETADDLVRAASEGALDILNLKISRVGGLSKARLLRDLCATLGIGLTVEDTWGGDIVTAAIAHLAQSTPAEALFTATDFNSYVSVSIATGAPERREGLMTAPDRPGLGIEPRFEVLGDPIFEVR